MEEGLRFAIREGGKTVGAGVVTKITEPEPGSESEPESAPESEPEPESESEPEPGSESEPESSRSRSRSRDGIGNPGRSFRRLRRRGDRLGVARGRFFRYPLAHLTLVMYTSASASPACPPRTMARTR
jgi:hypothetical protein